MKPKHKRLSLILAGLALLGIAAALAGTALRDNLVFFFGPTEVMAKPMAPDRRFRLGGLVEEGTVKREGATVSFRISDTVNAIQVVYTGLLPDLFREGQGVIAEGKMRDGVFRAETVLAKHDETYMPREVADSLKKAGHWKSDEGYGDKKN
ncbi:MAG: cytochrome c maturation protein CcmE [Alphaproteobacteria bacterium]|nr:cytochrome c maturation protein CcmE [Alphaproteobacteria bacterium]